MKFLDSFWRDVGQVESLLWLADHFVLQKPQLEPLKSCTWTFIENRVVFYWCNSCQLSRPTHSRKWHFRLFWHLLAKLDRLCSSRGATLWSVNPILRPKKELSNQNRVVALMANATALFLPNWAVLWSRVWKCWEYWEPPNLNQSLALPILMAY